jgi:DNA-binding response OmpR family regulator
MPDSRPIVLLVEDDQSISQLYSIKLRMDGYRVDIAKDAATAGILFDRSTPDVVCVDSRLPDGDGRDLVGTLVGRGAEVILLTNDQEAHDRPPAGVAASLLKWRTTPADLSAAINDLVGARKPH